VNFQLLLALFSYLPFDLVGVLSLLLSQLSFDFVELIQYKNSDHMTALDVAMKHNYSTLFPILCTSLTVQALSSMQRCLDLLLLIFCEFYLLFVVFVFMFIDFFFDFLFIFSCAWR
jgi:hypothetical protein